MSTNYNMILAGFGGQGILFAGKVIAYAGLMEDKEISWLPSYGPEMRGGTANCSVCISDKAIGSPLVTAPNALIAMNLPSFDKFIDTVVPGGTVVVDSFLIDKKVDREDVKAFYVPATKLAEENGLKGLANIILVGKLFKELGFCSEESLYKAIEKCVPARKANMLELNKRQLKSVWSSEMRLNSSCIFWDYNGTLIDDVEVALESVNDMLRKRSLPLINLQQYKSYIDTPISKFYEHIFDLNEISFDTIAHEFQQGYQKHIGDNPVMDGAQELLEYFSKRNKIQALVSGSQQSVIENGARRYGLYDYFDVISGADDHYVHSKVGRAQAIAKSYDLRSDDILVIGDCVQDYMVSQALGAECVLLSAGHQSREDLSSTGALVVDSLLDICEIVG